MPYLALVHLRELRCEMCDERLAEAGARSFVVDDRGDPVAFAADAIPHEMTVDIVCHSGHATRLDVPQTITAEETLSTPEEAPIATDATLHR